VLRDTVEDGVPGVAAEVGCQSAPPPRPS